MSWRDPNWKYEPAATHGDPALFAQRQRERALAYGQMLQQKTPRTVSHYGLLWNSDEIFKAWSEVRQ